MEDVWAACDAANVTEFVRTFPNGLHTFIGKCGKRGDHSHKHSKTIFLPRQARDKRRNS